MASLKVYSGHGEGVHGMGNSIDGGTKLRREGVGGKYPGGYSLTSFEDDGRLLIVVETNGVTMKRWFTRMSCISYFFFVSCCIYIYLSINKCINTPVIVYV